MSIYIYIYIYIFSFFKICLTCSYFLSFRPSAVSFAEYLIMEQGLRHNAAFTENFSNIIAKIRRRKHTPSVVHVFSPYVCEETYKAVGPESCEWVSLGWVSLQEDAGPHKRAFAWCTLNAKPYKPSSAFSSPSAGGLRFSSWAAWAVPRPQTRNREKPSLKPQAPSPEP